MSNNSKVLQEPSPSVPEKTGQKSSAHENGQASWGDRFKHSLFKLGTYTGINYFVNTFLSVAIAYHVERKGDKVLQGIANVAGKSVAKFTGWSESRQVEAFKNATKGITLTMGGTILIPVLKGLEDHRNAIEFKIGHGLDVIQDKLGLANQATRENLSEYKSIKHAVKTNTPVEGISPEAMKLIGRQHGLKVECDNKISFDEQKLPWSHAIIARAAAWGAAATTNYTLTFIGLKTILTASKSRLTEGISRIVPSYKKLADPDLFSANIANDAILTVSSSVTQPFVQKLLKNKKSRNAALAGDDDTCIQPDAQPATKWAAQVQPAADKISPEALKPVEGHLAQVEKSKAAANDASLAVRA